MTADVPPGPVANAALYRDDRQSFGATHRPLCGRHHALSRDKFWSRMKINLPFSKLGIVVGDPIFVPQGAGREELDNYRRRVEAALNETTAKAYAVAGADPARATPPPPAVCQP